MNTLMNAVCLLWLYLVASALAMFVMKVLARVKGWDCQPLFAWYDCWLGFYWDTAKWKLYFFPLPMVGVVLSFPRAGAGEPEGDRVVQDVFNHVQRALHSKHEAWSGGALSYAVVVPSSTHLRLVRQALVPLVQPTEATKAYMVLQSDRLRVRLMLPGEVTCGRGYDYILLVGLTPEHEKWVQCAVRTRLFPGGVMDRMAA